MDSVPAHMEAIRDKMNYLWTEINKTEQDADNIDSNDQQLQQHSAVDMETRLIATARHMTLRLKTAVTALSAGSAALLPTAMADKLDGTRKFTEQLYTDFMQVEFGFFIKIRIQEALSLYYLHDRVFISVKRTPVKGTEISSLRTQFEDSCTDLDVV